ncbi:hypothetical protein HYQ44_020157 [Verticillium longisporum]|nr:hypothetical protein HYQ44_020157 [Verticillium longisporum]
MATLALAHLSLARLANQKVIASDNDDMTEVHEALFQAGIIPNVISEFQPVLGLSASWSKDAAVSLGNSLDPSALSSPPSLQYAGAWDYLSTNESTGRENKMTG